MNLSAILGLAGTFIGLVRALPQLLRILRSGEALGVSVDTAATSSIVSFGWAAYGILTGQPYVTLATGASGTVFLLIAGFALRFRRESKEIRIAPVWLLVLIAAYGLAGEKGLGMVLPVSILVSNLPQLVMAFREQDLTDLSLGTWLFSVSDGLVWGLYSLIEQDYSIMVFAFFQLSTSGMIVLLKLMNRRKMQKRVVQP